jgi:hypothetical protein
MYERAEIQPFLDQLSLSGPIEPFLVFADWLQSRGDPWGELIVMMCNDLRLESYSVVAKHQQQLCTHDPLVGIAWHRGFVSTIAFSDSHGTDWLAGELAQLFAQPVTALCTELSFAGTQLGDDDVRALMRVKPHLDRIDRSGRLDLEGNWFTGPTVRALAHAFPRARLGNQRADPDERDDRGVLVKSWDERDDDP